MKFLNGLLGGKKRISYSQCGEDLIVDYVLSWLKIERVSYLDIGAGDPVELNNTYLFYRRGSSGVCVEPDPEIYSRLKRKRSRDTCLHAGVGPHPDAAAEFHVMSSRTLSTFSKQEARRYQSYGSQRLLKVIRVPLLPISGIIQDYFSECPNLVSLDVEGSELGILQSLDLSRYRPAVFCVETLSYTEDNTERKLTEIIDHMEGNGYMTYADTYINSVFVDSERWKSR